jgi:hypothetical protein
MWRKIIQPQLLTAIVIGLFAVRLIAELSAKFFSLLELLGLAIVSAGIVYVLCRIRKWPMSIPWWLGIPVVYILWPVYAPQTGLIALALVILIVLTQAELRSRWALQIFIFGLALLAYVVTLSPGVVPADGGEFQLTSTILGIAHPPGYPLYTLLGNLFSQLPQPDATQATLLGNIFGRLTRFDPAWRINLLSAVAAALSVMVVSASVRRLHTTQIWGSLASACSLAYLPIFWNVATAASVRPLTALFAATFAYAILGYAAAHQQDPNNPRKDLYLILFALMLALGLGHHASLVFTGACAGIAGLWIDPSFIRNPRRWIKPAIAFALGLMPLLYLPFRSAAGAPGGAGDLTTFQGFMHHITAQGFGDHIFQFTTLDDFVTRLRILLDILRYQFNDVLLVAALIGALILIRRQPRLAVMVVGGMLLHSFATATFRSPQISEYMIPAYVFLAILIGYAVNSLIEVSRVHLGSLLGRGLVHLAQLTAVLTLVAAVMIPIKSGPNAIWLARSTDTQDYVLGLLIEAPPQAIILANWHWYTALDYTLKIEGYRRDLEVRYVFPEGSNPPAVTWIKRIESALTENRPVIVTETYQVEYAASPYRFEPIAQAQLVQPEPRHDPPKELSTVNQTLGDWRLVGYRQTNKAIKVGSDFSIDIAWQLDKTAQQDTSFFVHLLGPDGIPISQFDLRHPANAVQAGEIVYDRYPLAIPPGMSPGSYRLLAGAYITTPDGKFERLKSATGSESIYLVDLSVQPNSLPAITQHPSAITFADGLTLLGVDHDFSLNGIQRVFLHWSEHPFAAYQVQILQGGTVVGSATLSAAARPQTINISVPPTIDSLGLRVLTANGSQVLEYRGVWGLSLATLVQLPGARFEDRYVPFGGAITLVGIDPSTNLQSNPAHYNLLFQARQPLLRDYTISLRLSAPGWSTVQQDSPPSLGAFPTIKWIRGPQIIDRHLITVPAELANGPIQSQMIIYDAFTQQALPILDPRLAQQGPLLSLSGTIP